MTTYDPMEHDEREDRLPQWAQEKLRVLRARHASALQEIDSYSHGDPEQSDTVADPHAWMSDRDRKPLALRDGTEVEFKIGKPVPGQPRARARVRVRRHLDGYLELSGDSPLNLKLMASNVVHVILEDR
jgi:hypothetical protein